MSAESEFTGDPDWPTLDWIEREYITARFKHFNGDKPLTAKSLGISLKTLYNRLGRYQPIDNRKLASNELTDSECENQRLDRAASRVVRELCSAPLSAVVPMILNERRRKAWKRPHGKDGRFLSPNPLRQEMRL